jgi:hypothetical protein
MNDRFTHAGGPDPERSHRMGGPISAAHTAKVFHLLARAHPQIWNAVVPHGAEAGTRQRRTCSGGPYGRWSAGSPRRPSPRSRPVAAAEGSWRRSPRTGAACPRSTRSPGPSAGRSRTGRIPSCRRTRSARTCPRTPSGPTSGPSASGPAVGHARRPGHRRTAVPALRGGHRRRVTEPRLRRCRRQAPVRGGRRRAGGRTGGMSRERPDQLFVAPWINRRRPSVSCSAVVAESGSKSHWTIRPLSNVW